MSRRQPPLPRGPPPDHRSYRPAPFKHGNDNYTPNRNTDTYTFGGTYERAPSAHYDNYTPDRTDHYAPTPGRGPNPPSGSTYRPPRGEFTYRHDAPSSISNNYDTYKPLPPPRQPRDNAPSRSNYQRQNNNNFHANNHIHGQNGVHQRGYRGRGGPRLAADREFLRAKRDPTPELLPGMVEVEHQAKYIAIEDVSDSSEAEMDLYDDGDGGQPTKKQARTKKRAADGDSVPKWSNPDPYTTLPPPDAGEKKKDLVKLIKKARLGVGSTALAKPEVVTDDFISFDFGGDEEADAVHDGANGNKNSISNAPIGPRVEPRIEGSLMSNKENSSQNGYDPVQKHTGDQFTPPVNALAANPDLGSRKRTIRDEIKEAPTLRDALATAAPIKAPNLHKSQKGKKPPASGEVLQEWRGYATPWINIDHRDTVNLGLRLHKEILDFYEYVKPRGYEAFIRGKLVEDLHYRLRDTVPTVDIRTFGSFPAGLYLPNADMDIVCVSDSYMDGGYKELQGSDEVYKFSRWLKNQGLPIPGTVECIAKARVPLVKYVDKITGLKVDISFENDTGLVANNTFQHWKKQYPAMPIIVTLVKHLLAMRGLNEPVNGGIGGFSVICLVVSLLQNMPQVISGAMVAEHHLGEIFMEFLDLYGNQFDWTATAIQLNPPRYASKAKLPSIPYRSKQTPKICIIDPNNPANDISGGSSNTTTILKCFSEAYTALQTGMGLWQYEDQPLKGGPPQLPPSSLLACIFAGNYSSFELQREHLAHIHRKAYGSIEDRL